MQVFGVQFDIAWEDKAANYARVRTLIAGANPPAGSLLVLPEMFATGFSMNVDAVAEAVDGPTQTPSFRLGGRATLSCGSGGRHAQRRWPGPQ